MCLCIFGPKGAIQIRYYYYYYYISQFDKIGTELNFDFFYLDIY